MSRRRSSISRQIRRKKVFIVNDPGKSSGISYKRSNHIKTKNEINQDATDAFGQVGTPHKSSDHE